MCGQGDATFGRGVVSRSHSPQSEKSGLRHCFDRPIRRRQSLLSFTVEQGTLLNWPDNCRFSKNNVPDVFQDTSTTIPGHAVSALSGIGCTATAELTQIAIT
jgi:hypothetical protein